MERAKLTFFILMSWLLLQPGCCCSPGPMKYDISTCIDQDLGTANLQDSLAYTVHSGNDSAFAMVNDSGLIQYFTPLNDTIEQNSLQFLHSRTVKESCYDTECSHVIRCMRERNAFISDLGIIIEFNRLNKVISTGEEYNQHGTIRTEEEAFVMLQNYKFPLPPRLPENGYEFFSYYLIGNKLYSNVYRILVTNASNNGKVYISTIFFNREYGLLRYYLSRGESWSRLP